MNSILSIFIPTYNRKERLIAQLQSLYVQSRISEVPVVISDNASDYSIEDEVLPLFKDKMDLRLYRFGTNTTGIVNISSVYLYSQTEWVWMLGDDKLVMLGWQAQVPLSDGIRRTLMAYDK